MDNYPKVLIVDDLPKNVKLLEAHLSHSGYSTEAAFDGEQALEKIGDSPPDIVLLDVMMPKVDGFEVCRRIKSNESTRRIPVVMVTALDQIEDKVKGIDAGADDFLTKPVNRLELLARVRSLVKTKHLNDEVVSLKSVLSSLFEITTFTEQYSDINVLLTDFARKAAELAKASSTVITMRQNGDYKVEAEYNGKGEIEAQRSLDRKSAVWTVMDKKKTLVVKGNDNEALSRYGLASGYIGVPLMSLGGNVFGAIHAFGIGQDVPEESLRMLIIVAQRLGYELNLKDYNRDLEKNVKQATAELSQALIDLKSANVTLSRAQEDTIFRLAKAAEYRDEDTAAHLHRMSNYAYIVAKQMDKESDFCELIKSSSTMHDVGKIGTPDSILFKPSKLSSDEFDTIKDHTLIGAKILGGSSSELLRMSERIALSHHEKFNGKGYPNGLSDTNIPIEARIVAIADVFDALTTKRVYKRAYSVEEALEIMSPERGLHFDPNVYDAFMDSLTEILAIKERFPELKI